MPPVRLLLIALTAVLTMSLVPVLVKLVSANETTIAVARLAIGIAFFTPLALKGGQLRGLPKKDWLTLLVIGLVFAVHWQTYFMSIKLAGAGLGAMAISTYGMQYLVLAWAINKEPISAVEWCAVVVCMAACVVAAPSLTLSNQVAQGLAIGLFTAFLYALMPLLHQRIAHLSTSVRTWGQFSFAMLGFAFFLPVTQWQLTPQDWIYLSVLGVVSTVVAHSLWIKASTEMPPLFTSVIYYLYLPSAMIQAAYFADEPLDTQKSLAAGMIVVASVGITYYRWRRQVSV